MTRYRLPAEFGGGEVRRTSPHKATKYVTVLPVAGGWIAKFPVDALTEVPPPIPDEPPPGAYLIGDTLCVHLGKRGGLSWFADADLPALRFRMDWPALVQAIGIDDGVSIRPLTASPTLPEVSLPWTFTDVYQDPLVIERVDHRVLMRMTSFNEEDSMEIELTTHDDRMAAIAAIYAADCLAAAGPDTEREA